MTILLIGGEAKVNVKWLNKLDQKISDSSLIYNYKHWQENKEEIDFESELNQLECIVKEQKIDKIIAKSAGILLSLYAIEKKILTPNECIFMGFPLIWAEKRNLEKDLINLSKKNMVNTIYIQQKNDPLCSSSNLNSILNNNQIKEIEGDDHWYGNFSFFSKFLK